MFVANRVMSDIFFCWIDSIALDRLLVKIASHAQISSNDAKMRFAIIARRWHAAIPYNIFMRVHRLIKWVKFMTIFVFAPNALLQQLVSILFFGILHFNSLFIKNCEKIW